MESPTSSRELTRGVKSLVRGLWSTIGRDNTGRGIRALLRFLRPYRWQAAGLIVLGITASLFEAIGISLIVPVLQALSSQVNGDASTAGNLLVDLLSRPFAGIPQKQRLPVIVAIMLVLILLKNVVTYALAVSTARLQIRLQRHLSMAVFDQLMRVGYRFIVERQTGDLLNHLNSETSRTGMALQVLIQMLTGLFLVAGYGALLLLISWPLTLVAIAFLLFLSWTLQLAARAARALGRDMSQVNSQLSQISVESLAAMRLVRCFGREPFERQRYHAKMVESGTLQLRSAKLGQLITPLSEVVSVAFLVVLLLLATHLVIRQSDLLLPLLLTFLFVLYRLLPRVALLNALRVQLAQHVAGAEAVSRMLDLRDKPFVVSGTRPFQGLRNAICFEQVTFAYKPEEGPVLRDICLEIAAGCTTALVGVSGVGKSTLSDLVLRFYDPDSGRIAVDGIDLRNLDLARWRAAIGVVSQDTFVFNATVRENIAYGRLDATGDEIIDAARRANAHEFIMAMADGYDTLIGDRGVRLSAGQRQRIAIARAILRNPQILILDEATSALDSESEWQVQQALYELSSHRTVLVIAHRLSTIANADQIIVLANGRVVERGTHPELVSQQGSYYAFWRLQSGEHGILEGQAPQQAGS